MAVLQSTPITTTVKFNRFCSKDDLFAAHRAYLLDAKVQVTLADGRKGELKIRSLEYADLIGERVNESRSWMYAIKGSFIGIYSEEAKVSHGAYEGCVTFMEGRKGELTLTHWKPGRLDEILDEIRAEEESA